VEESVEPLEHVREEIAGYIMSIRDQKFRPTGLKEGTRKRGATRLRSDQVSVTISGGIAERGGECAEADDVIAAADKNLYKAKKAGRNRLAH
jgi:GGDEF domain-containing protein